MTTRHVPYSRPRAPNSLVSIVIICFALSMFFTALVAGVWSTHAIQEWGRIHDYDSDMYPDLAYILSPMTTPITIFSGLIISASWIVSTINQFAYEVSLRGDS